LSVAVWPAADADGGRGNFLNLSFDIPLVQLTAWSSSVTFGLDKIFSAVKKTRRAESAARRQHEMKFAFNACACR
jgi:hypothetical protein